MVNNVKIFVVGDRLLNLRPVARGRARTSDPDLTGRNFYRPLKRHAKDPTVLPPLVRNVVCIVSTR